MDNNQPQDGALGTPEDAGEGERGEVSRWGMEIDLASKTEKDWRVKANKAIDRYRDERERKDWKFNIYWANVETLMPQLYSTRPVLDVRRRFADADPVGKVAADVLERALDFSLDSYDFDEEINNVLLNYCIPSRGVARVRFMPTIEVQEGGDGIYEKLTYAKTEIEHVSWDRFRRGPGITWKEVPWVAYEHQLTRDEVDGQFPGFGSKVDYDITMEGVEREKADAEPSVFKRVRIWEIWDKQEREILFYAPSYSDGFLKREPDKLNLEGFFDCERPLYAVSTATTLVPQVEYEMYRDQARELDRVTMRISKLVNSLKQRGIYDSAIAEFKELMNASDNEMIPTSTAAAAMAAGGLEKGIWMMPIGEAADILRSLVEYREQVKQTIYEITGFSDLSRAATDPSETATAQSLKMQTGGRRIQRRQRDVQRFIRGLLRKKAEIIAENYTPELLGLMTNVKLPHDADKRHARMQIQMQQAQYQQALRQHQAMQGTMNGQPSPQQPPPPPPQPDPEIQAMLASPSWEDVMKVLRSDILRNFRIDIETDSTIAADQAAEREQVTELIDGVGSFIQQVGPAVERGFISEDAAKQILISCLRRFKFGAEVEDTLENDKPQQQKKPDPEMAKAQAMMQVEQAKLRAQTQLEESKVQNQMKLEQFKAQNQAQVDQANQRAQAQQNTQQNQAEAARKLRELEMAHQINVLKADADKEARMHEITLKADLDAELQRQKYGLEARNESMARADDNRHDMARAALTTAADLHKHAVTSRQSKGEA